MGLTEGMSPNKEDFNIAGPKHLTVVDWGNDDHKRIVAASLVRGVYVLERDRQLGRNGPNAFGPTWWEFFHFKLYQTLVDKSTIFGVILKYEQPNQSSTDGFPNYIVAFRGTLLKLETALEDLYQDLLICINKLHKTRQVETAREVVKKILESTPNANVWLAGHSLGASMALLVGRYLSSGNTNLESFLFNPPYISIPIEEIDDKMIKYTIRIGKSFVKAGVALAMRKTLELSSSEFVGEASTKWVPNLFVHPSDVICSEYIGYFGNMRVMDKWWMGWISRLASQHSFGGLMMTAFGKVAEPAAHLIPSARLIMNISSESNLCKAHSLKQWWSMDLQVQTDIHMYD